MPRYLPLAYTYMQVYLIRLKDPKYMNCNNYRVDTVISIDVNLLDEVIIILGYLLSPATLNLRHVS